MEHNVGVGMAGKPRAVRNLDAAQNELPPALETMRVEAVSDAEVGRHDSSSLILVNRRSDHYAIPTNMQTALALGP
jgi:hypothetical protein